jgi:chromosome segregation ATPase
LTVQDGDDDNYDEVPNSEFTIARSANKASTSTYYINERTVQFKVGLAFVFARLL